MIRNKFGYIIAYVYLCYMKSMTIQVEFYDDPDLPEKYLATITEPKMAGMVVSGTSLRGVLTELATLIVVLEEYNKMPILG